MSDIQRNREERQHVIEVLKSWDGYFIGYTSDEVQEALRYAIASIKTDLKYDLLYEETSGQADKPTTKNDLAVDCISRKAVLDAIDSKTWEFCDYLISKGRNDEQKPVSHFADNLRECVREEMTSVTPQEPRWVPVSERLPEDRREVLVTAYWHETYQVMMASYYGDGLWWCVPFNNCGEHMQRLNPKAWMPLPLPWEGENEG